MFVTGLKSKLEKQVNAITRLKIHSKVVRAVARANRNARR